jgi:O-antigen ligase
MVLAARRLARDRGGDLLMLPAVGGACLLGALSSYVAYAGRPMAVLLLVVACSLLLVTLARPAVGVAVGIALYPLGILGLLGEPGWVAPTAWTALLFGLALARWEDRTASRAMAPLTPALLAVLAAALVSLAVRGEVEEALPILRSTASGAMLYVAVVAFVTSRAALAWVLAALTVVGLLVGGLALWQYASGSGDVGFFSGSGALVTRVDAGFVQPNQLAGFLVLLVPFLLAASILRVPGRWLAAAAAGLAVAGIALTFSRSALIALLVIPLFFLRPRWSLLLGPAVAALLVLSGPDVLKERFSTLSEDGSDIATRVDFWRAGVSIFSDHPLLGVGPGGFADAYSESRLPGKQFLPHTIFEPPPHAHNLAINTGAEQGLLGLAALALLVVAAVRVARRARAGATPSAVALGRAGLAATAAFFVHNAFDVTMLETTGTVYLALMGLMTTATHITAGDEPGDG